MLFSCSLRSTTTHRLPCDLAHPGTCKACCCSLQLTCTEKARPRQGPDMGKSGRGGRLRIDSHAVQHTLEHANLVVVQFSSVQLFIKKHKYAYILLRSSTPWQIQTLFSCSVQLLFIKEHTYAFSAAVWHTLANTNPVQLFQFSCCSLRSTNMHIF